MIFFIICCSVKPNGIIIICREKVKKKVDYVNYKHSNDNIVTAKKRRASIAKEYLNVNF